MQEDKQEQRKEVEEERKRIAANPAPYLGEFDFQHLETKKLIKTQVRTQIIYDHKKKPV